MLVFFGVISVSIGVETQLETTDRRDAWGDGLLVYGDIILDVSSRFEWVPPQGVGMDEEAFAALSNIAAIALTDPAPVDGLLASIGVPNSLVVLGVGIEKALI